MDATDHQLIALLRKDARTSIAVLAKKLGVSRGTVSNRIIKLEDTGVIVGYTVRLRPDAQPNEIKAWMGETVLTEQAMVNAVKYPGQTVGQALAKAGLTLTTFVRYRVGSA